MAVRFAFVIALLLSWNGVALADGEALKGLKEIQIVFDDFDADAEKCGMTESEIKNRITLPVQAYTKLRFVDEAKSLLYVTVTTLVDNEICVNNIDFRASTYAMSQPPHMETQMAVQIVMWEHSALATDKLDLKGKDALEMVDSLAKDFAAAWQKFNP